MGKKCFSKFKQRHAIDELLSWSVTFTQRSNILLCAVFLTTMKRYLFLTIILVVIGTRAPAGNPEVKSMKFPELEPRLHMKDNHTWVINFWATWCAPCVKEMPYFQQIAADYETKGVKVVLVSLDHPRQIESRVIPFIQRLKINQEVILLADPDANSWIDKVSPEWSGALPATLIYNSRHRKFYEQPFDLDKLREAVENVIQY